MNRKIELKEKERYSECPVCNCSEIYSNLPIDSKGNLVIITSCGKCSYTWKEVFVFSHNDFPICAEENKKSNMGRVTEDTKILKG